MYEDVEDVEEEDEDDDDILTCFLRPDDLAHEVRIAL
jgi:hypothetical protein